MAGIKPDAVVIVATVRALKYNGGVAKPDLNEENLEALENGIPNLMKHVDNIKNVYGLPCVVAINAFPTDTKAELDLVEEKCKEVGVNVALSEVWAKGGEGGLKLAEEDDPKKLGAPKDFDITVRNLKVSAGAGFIVALTGDIMTMPGLPKVPAAERIDVDDEGRITGLF